MEGVQNDLGVKVSIVWREERLQLELNRHCVCSYEVGKEWFYYFHPFPELGEFFTFGVIHEVERS